ncbi:hypothetical protein [Paenibacillus chungangensis]|uniref:ABC transmembrane type-1 domain-containing protein n=1 Tax=Paenibacillus chungangensis TaxID=696535 RepID=A0ABW3HWN2_9BACL
MIYRGLGNRLFDSINVMVLILFSLITVLPFVHVIATSFATQQDYMQSKFLLVPKQFTTAAYQYIISNYLLLHSLMITIFITVAGLGESTAQDVSLSPIPIVYPFLQKRNSVRLC